MTFRKCRAVGKGNAYFLMDFMPIFCRFIFFLGSLVVYADVCAFMGKVLLSITVQ